MNSPQHSTESNEHYTPPEIVERARRTMGRIDFDPFSCEAANKIVQATYYCTPEIGGDGFLDKWSGEMVFVNPPCGVLDIEYARQIRLAGTRSSAGVAWARTVWELINGPVRAAIFVGFNIEILRVGQSAQFSPMDFAFCVPKSRLKYVEGKTGKPGPSPPHSSVIICATYDREIEARFLAEFADLGYVRERAK
ncbi:C-5 cytosine specific DNA methylase [Caudoviricetes sp.]|nr:C-5 cytosine specific DNA methylase [Caudoviricetes sp.]